MITYGDSLSTCEDMAVRVVIRVGRWGCCCSYTSAFEFVLCSIARELSMGVSYKYLGSIKIISGVK